MFPELARLALVEFVTPKDWNECLRLYPNVTDWSMRFNNTSPALLRHKFHELAAIYEEVRNSQQALTTAVSETQNTSQE